MACSTTTPREERHTTNPPPRADAKAVVVQRGCLSCPRLTGRSIAGEGFPEAVTLGSQAPLHSGGLRLPPPMLCSTADGRNKNLKAGPVCTIVFHRSISAPCFAAVLFPVALSDRPLRRTCEREFFIDDLLVRIHLII